MKKLFLFLILILPTLGMFAQSGYLGKRLSLNITGDFFPSIRNNPSNDLLGMSFKGIKTTGGILASFVRSDNKVIELAFTQFKDWDAIYDYELDDITAIDYIKQNCLLLNLKRFRKNSIAPVGAFGKLSLGITQNIFSKNIDFDNPTTLYGVKIGAGFGKQRVFFDRIVIDYGITAYLNIFGIKYFFTNPEELPVERVIYRDHLNIHVGIGYLLF